MPGNNGQPEPKIDSTLTNTRRPWTHTGSHRTDEKHTTDKKSKADPLQRRPLTCFTTIGVSACAREAHTIFNQRIRRAGAFIVQAARHCGRQQEPTGVLLNCKVQCLTQRCIGSRLDSLHQLRVRLYHRSSTGRHLRTCSGKPAKPSTNTSDAHKNRSWCIANDGGIRR